MTDLLLERMLELPEFGIIDFEQGPKDMVFYLQVKGLPSLCPKCGMYLPRLVIQKTRTQEVRDLNILGKHVTLSIRRRYFRCLECSSMFAEPLQCVEDKSRLTSRLRKYIALKARYTPFVDLENEYHISDTTIRKAFLEDVRKLPALSDMRTPSILGIDEICLIKNEYHRKQAWAIIANGDENTVMELLKDRNKTSVIALLKSLQHPHNVRIVTMDMWSGYRAAVQEVLPHALVVVDKFHVVRMANETLDSVRRQITRVGPFMLKKNRNIFLMREKRLSEKAISLRNEWFDAYPLLRIAYNLKEDFYKMYDCSDRDSAKRYFAEWEKQIPKELPGFRAISRTVKRSQSEIFNYFDAPYTNAFVEGLNRVVRAIADQGCGYDFEVLRGKVLFTAGRKKSIGDYSF